MIENVLDKLAQNIFIWVTGKPRTSKSLLIKKHADNLQSHGDLSFPNTVNSWHGHLQSRKCNIEEISIMRCIGKDVEELVEVSKNWVLKVKNAKEQKDRVYIFLDRTQAIRVGLLAALKNNQIICQRMQEITSKVQCDKDFDNKICLTSLRLKYLCKAVKNLYSIHFTCTEATPTVIITPRSAFKSGDHRLLLCGAVLNAKTGVKEVSVTADDFIRIRQDEMTLIAQHKYGLRVTTDPKWKEFIAHLGESAVAFELLQTKPNSAVKINLDCSSTGSSKGAAFVLYNCARLETIIRTFNAKVDEGVYPSLPNLEDIDFSLLNHEEEWCLVFNFILGFPSLLNNCVEINERICDVRPHHLCSFLCSMVKIVSQYYRRVRILTEPRKHLLPVMFARIHLINTVNDTLKTCLKVLNIKSVSQM